MARATMSDLLAAVKAVVSKISASQAKAFIKANNLTTVDKATEEAATLKGHTKEQLAAEFGEDDGTEFPASTTATKNGKSKAHATKRVARKGTESRRRVAAMVEAGPRGFRFGDRWNQSVIDGTAPALAPANRNKLFAHADELGVQYDKRSVDTADLAKKMARKLA